MNFCAYLGSLNQISLKSTTLVNIFIGAKNFTRGSKSLDIMTAKSKLWVFFFHLIGALFYPRAELHTTGFL